MAIFLMGCYDPASNTFRTVSKCGIGLDVRTLDDLQTTLDTVKISKNVQRVPSWLTVDKQVRRLFLRRSMLNMLFRRVCQYDPRLWFGTYQPGADVCPPPSFRRLLD